MIFLLSVLALSQPTHVDAFDKPNDAGGAIVLRWQLSRDDSLVQRYIVLRRTLPDTAYERIGFTMHGVSSFEDTETEDGKEYCYVIAATDNAELFLSEPSAIVQSAPQVFHMGRINIAVCIIIFSVLLVIFVARAKRGKSLFVRKIPGMDAVDEAVGRATEMGKPILYIPGIADIDYTATIASLNILGEVAKKIAVYDTPLIVANRWSVTYNVAKEVVKEAFATEGRPDKFKEDYVRYLTEAQFGFAAAVNGIMVREQPATNFFIGGFWAESLIMAETGAQIGAIQIAGTDQVLQLPFFVASCDYTLIGEEVYAASAYLSHEPLLLGSLKAQDYGKLIVLIILIAFTFLSLFKINLLSLIAVQ